MLFANKSGNILNKSKTPQKMLTNSINSSTPNKSFKKQSNRIENNYDKKKILKDNNKTFKSKTKDSYLILESLEEIYN